MKHRSDAKFGISTNMIHTAIGPSALFRCDTKRTRIFNVRISNGGKSSTTRSQRRKGCTVLNVVPQISKGPLVVNAVDIYIFFVEVFKAKGRACDEPVICPDYLVRTNC